MTEARLSVVIIALLIFGVVTLIFGRIIQDYFLAAGIGGGGALIFAAAGLFLATDGEKRLQDPPKGD